MLLMTNQTVSCERVKHFGPLTLKVWRADGSEKTWACKGYRQAFDMVDAEKHPMLRWELHGETSLPMRGAEESWFVFGARLAEMNLEDELANYQWLKWGDWNSLVEGFQSGRV